MNHKPSTSSLFSRMRDFNIESVNSNRKILRALYRETSTRTVRSNSRSPFPTRSQMDNYSVQNNKEFSQFHMITIETFKLNKTLLGKDFYSLHNKSIREWFLAKYSSNEVLQIFKKFYEFYKNKKINILFFLWFA